MRRIVASLVALAIAATLSVTGAFPATARYLEAGLYEQSADLSYPTKTYRPASLRTHTVFRPARLRTLTSKMPLVVWENGECANDPYVSRVFLEELASRGFLVIAKGFEGGTEVPAPEASPVELMVEAIDWAARQNRAARGHYRNRVDMRRVSAMGYSCGGYTALDVAGVDERVRSILIFNSSTRPGSDPQPVLSQITVPLAIINGGPTDIAYPTGVVNYEVASSMPIWKAEYLTVGSGHTEFWNIAGVAGQPSPLPHVHDPSLYWQPLLAHVAATWLDYTLLTRSASSGKYFLGDPCGLCSADPMWSAQYKNWESFQASS